MTGAGTCAASGGQGGGAGVCKRAQRESGGRQPSAPRVWRSWVCRRHAGGCAGVSRLCLVVVQQPSRSGMRSAWVPNARPLPRKRGRKAARMRWSTRWTGWAPRAFSASWHGMQRSSVGLLLLGTCGLRALVVGGRGVLGMVVRQGGDWLADGCLYRYHVCYIYIYTLDIVDQCVTMLSAKQLSKNVVHHVFFPGLFHISCLTWALFCL